MKRVARNKEHQKLLSSEQQKTHSHGNTAQQEIHKPTSLSRTAAQRFAEAIWGPLVGLAVNIVLVVIKVLAGLASGSVALLADAGHSGADVANNILVLASLFYARRGADETHPYGHDRAEVLAAIASAFILMGAGLFFGWDSIQKIIVGTPEPSLLALWVAIGTLVVKVVVVWFEMRIGKKVHSQAIQLAEQVRESVYAEVPSVGDVVVELNTNHFARLRKKLR